MAPGIGDCFLSETAVMKCPRLFSLSPSLFYLTPPSSLNSTDGETVNCTRVLSCHGGIVAGAEWWEGGGYPRGKRLRGGVKWIKQRKNGILSNNQRMWWGWVGGKATAAADNLMMGKLGEGGDWKDLTPVGEWGYSARMGLTICCSCRRWSWDGPFNPVQKC